MFNLIKYCRAVAALAVFAVGGTVAPQIAAAGVIFEYSSAQRADVFGFIEFYDGVDANPGEFWTLAGVAGFAINHGAFSYSSADFPGFLSSGPAEFGVDNPFANFSVMDNPVQLGPKGLGGEGESIVLIHLLASAVLYNDPQLGIYFDDVVSIAWNRVSATAVTEPASTALAVLGIMMVGAGRLRQSRRG